MTVVFLRILFFVVAIALYTSADAKQTYEHSPHNETKVLFNIEDLSVSRLDGEISSNGACNATFSVVIPITRLDDFAVSIESMLPIMRRMTSKWSRAAAFSDNSYPCITRNGLPFSRVLLRVYFENVFFVVDNYSLAAVMRPKEDVGYSNGKLRERAPIVINFLVSDGKLKKNHRDNYGEIKETITWGGKNIKERFVYKDLESAALENEVRANEASEKYHKHDEVVQRRIKKEIEILGAEMTAFYFSDDPLKHEVSTLLRAFFISDEPEKYFTVDKYIPTLRSGYGETGFMHFNVDDRFDYAIWAYILVIADSCPTAIPGGLRRYNVKTTKERTGEFVEEIRGNIPKEFFSFLKDQINNGDMGIKKLKDYYGTNSYAKALRKVMELKKCNTSLINKYHSNLWRVIDKKEWEANYR